MSSTLCPPCTKPTTLNADRKAQNRRNARARVFKVRLICPAVVTKTRGAEAISAAASSASRCSEKRGSVRFEHAHAKRAPAFTRAFTRAITRVRTHAPGVQQIPALRICRRVEHVLQLPLRTPYEVKCPYEVPLLHGALTKSLVIMEFL